MAQGNGPTDGFIDELNGDAALRNGEAILSSVGNADFGGPSSSGNPSESGLTVEALSAALGSLGASGDALRTTYISQGAGGTSALATEFVSSVGETVSRWSLVASVIIDGGQAVAEFGTEEGWFHAVDTDVDVGVTKLGLVGVGVGLIWTATGGAKVQANNPALQPLEPPF